MFKLKKNNSVIAIADNKFVDDGNDIRNLKIDKKNNRNK